MKIIMKGITFSYSSSLVLDEIYMELLPAEILCIVGPNGSGKSTLLRCIDQILKPKKGSILLDGKDINHMGKMEIARYMGYVPQSSSNAFPATVFDAVLMGRRPHLGWRSSDNDIDKVSEALKLLDIENFALRDFSEISGGERQKVLLARAIAQEADVLLLDEPTSNLDVRHQLEVMNIVEKLVKEKGISAIITIHDLNLASKYADRVIILNEGKIYGAGDPLSVLIPENITSAYGVDVIVKNEFGRPYIIPVRPSDVSDFPAAIVSQREYAATVKTGN